MKNEPTLDANGLNANINAVILEDEKMRELGFTDHSEKNWYYTIRVGAGVSFNLSIPKDGSRLRIDVLDEDFGQPYDYQQFLKKNPEFPFGLRVKEAVERVMKDFTEAGVLTGWKPGDYI